MIPVFKVSILYGSKFAQQRNILECNMTLLYSRSSFFKWYAGLCLWWGWLCNVPF